jgi:hypothetical protein
LEAAAGGVVVVLWQARGEEEEEEEAARVFGVAYATAWTLKVPWEALWAFSSVWSANVERHKEHISGLGGMTVCQKVRACKGLRR